MTQEQIAQELAIGKHVITFAAGAAMTFGIMTHGDADTLVTSFDHLVNGVKEIAAGVAPLVALGMGLWARYNASNAAKTASVATIPGAMVVQSSGSDPVALASKIASFPEVHTVVSTPAVASATVSDKVVSS